MNDFNSLLNDLEIEASGLLDGKMDPFEKSKRNIVCPWLNWRKNDATLENIRGIFIMQDWWCSSDESLEENVKYIENKTFSYDKDRTNYNLYNTPAWKKAIWGDKTWLVTNAVWGLRNSEIWKDKSSGYLGATIHAAAFPIWSQIINYFAKNDDFKVVLAGGWAVFEHTKLNDENLKQYLENWKTWTGGVIGKNTKPAKFDFQGVKGRAYFCSHPAVWNRKFNYLQGPPD